MRLKYLLRLYITLLLIFVTQKVIFMLVNMGLANGAPFGECALALWHGLRLDSVTACYIMILPAVVMLISCFTKRLAARRILRPYYLIVALLVGIIFVADMVLYLFWGAKLDANDLMYATKPKDMLASLEWWEIVGAIVGVVGVVWHYYRRMNHATPKQITQLHRKWYALLALPIGALLFLGIRGGVSESTANPSYAYFSPYSFCNHAALNPTFNMLHSLFKSQDLEHEFDLHTEEEVAAVIGDAFQYDPTLVDTLFNCTRPNILLIIWESGGSGMVMNDSVGPCISRLAQEGIYFSNCMADNFRTDRGLVSLLNGWLGLPTTSLMKRSDLCRNLPALAKSLGSNGYRTGFTYGGDIDFTNMRYYLTETGFTHIEGGQSFPKAWHQSAWGVPDHLVLTPSLIPSERPFFQAVLTLSSHEPWDVPMKRLESPRPNAFAYTDSCIGALVEQLHKMPLWDSLLVIIVPDHGVPFGEARATSDSRVAHIPLVMTGGAIKKAHKIDALMSQSDLAATLLSQMKIDAKDFVFSRNILSESYPNKPQFAMHAYKNGLNFITADGIDTYDCLNRSMLTPTSDSAALFIESLLQYLYQTSASLSKR